MLLTRLTESESTTSRPRAAWRRPLARLALLGALLSGPSAHASDPPAASSSASATLGSPTAQAGGVAVKIRDRVVFEVRAGRNEGSPASRAQKATKALEGLVEEREEAEIRVVDEGDVAVVYAGQAPVIQLTTADAVAAGDTSLAVHAAAVASRVRQGLHSERQRHHAAQSVFSVSLLVFSALLALLLVRKLDELLERLRERLSSLPGGGPKLLVQGIEVLPPSVVLGSMGVSLGAARVLLRVAAAYGWLAFALSLFDATRGYTARLTGAVVTPLSELLQRLIGAAPLLVVAAVVGFVLLVLLRFLTVFFQGFTAGTTRRRWMPPELAGPTSLLVQVGVVVLTLVGVLPLVTGSDQGLIGRLGLVVLGALGLGLTPLVASVMVGVVQVYGRRLSRGDAVRLGEHDGRVIEVNLIETQIESDGGKVTRVPHLLTLVRPTQITHAAVEHEATVCVASDADPPAVLAALQEAARRKGEPRGVSLERIDLDGALYRVRVFPAQKLERGELLIELASELRQRGIPLGRQRSER